MIWILLVVFQLKHFIADYPLQTPYMLGKFKPSGWVLPLSCHCAVQAGFTYIIALAALWNTEKGLLYATGFAWLDFAIHFAMDRIKASPECLGRFESLSKEQFKGLSEARMLAVSAAAHFKELLGMTASYNASVYEIEKIDKKIKGNKYFWWALGFDQMVHHLTDILIVFLIMSVIQ